MVSRREKGSGGRGTKPNDVHPRTLVQAVGARLQAGLRVVAAHAPMLRRRLAVAIAGTATLATIGLTLPVPQTPGRTRGQERLQLTTVAAFSAAPGAVVGSTKPGRAGAEDSALIMVDRLGGVPLDPAASGTRLVDGASGGSACAPLRLRVSWERPAPGFKIGAYVAPLGPAPTTATTRVNGIVFCNGSRYAYLGFEELWDGTRWLVIPVPTTGADAHE